MKPRAIKAARIVLAYALATGPMLVLAPPILGAPRFEDDPVYYVTAWVLGAVTSAAFAFWRNAPSRSART